MKTGITIEEFNALLSVKTEELPLMAALRELSEVEAPEAIVKAATVVELFWT